MGKNVYVYLLVFVALFTVKSFFTSLFVKGKERVNAVFYDARTTYYSIDFKGSINYRIDFQNDLKVTVPGGYGKYRVGGVGKLVSLEKKPEIFKKAFSSAISTFTDLYFYPPSPLIYHGEASGNGENILSKVFLYRSNANFFDRLYLAWQFIAINKGDFTNLSFFDEESFFKKYQGFFYKRSYRKEKSNVQLVYTERYKNALEIARIIEGNGVRIVSLSYEKEGKGSCLVLDKAKSQTAKDLAEFFGCRLLRKQRQSFDIILKLNETEKNWQAD